MEKSRSFIRSFFLFLLLFFFSGICAQSTFSCDGKLYFFRADPNNPNGYLAYIDNYTTNPVVTSICPLPTQAHNGLAANPVNNLLYYLENQNLRSLDANCNSSIVCPNIGFSSLSGACDNYGRYWTINANSALVAIDINTCGIVKGPYPNFSGALDIAYNLYDCHIYVNSGSTLKKVDTNGVIVNTYPVTFNPPGTYGGTAFGTNGLLYGVAGNDPAGNLSYIDVQTLTSNNVFNFGPGPTFARSDMASFACVRVDAYLTATPTTGCAPLFVQFTDTSIALPGPVNYWSWDFGDGSPLSSQQNPTHTYNNPGTYTVTLIVGTTTGCNMNDYDTATVVITVTNGPNASITSPLTICTGNNTTLTAGGGSTYQWSTGATTSAITVSPTATTTYTVTVSSGSCSTTVTTTVTVDPLPTVTVSGASICQGDSAQLLASGATQYNWQPGNMSGANVIVYPSATTTYTVTGTGSSGCSSSATVTVTVAAAVTATVTPSLSVCSGNTASLTAGGGSNYLWSNGATTSTISVNPSATTSYTVTVSSGQCSDTATTTVTVNPLPTVTTSGASICPGDSAQLSASGAMQYTWQPGNQNGSTVILTPTSTTTYTVTGTGANGCSASVTVTVTVANVLNATVSPSMSVCSGNSASLSAGGGNNYLWMPGNFTTVSINVTPSSSTTYTVTVSSGTCTDTAMVNVTVLAVPVVSVSSASMCEGETVTLTASGAASYTWNPGNQNGTSLTVSPSSSQVYTVTGTSANGCSATAQGSVTVYSAPSAAFHTDPSDAEPGVNTIYFINTSSGGTQWLWNFGDNSTSTQEHPVHTYAEPGTYTVWLVVTNASGCTDSISYTVEIKPNWSIYFPNAFTPDGNGNNEVFYAYGDNILEFEMFIFDRWGNLLFQTSDINKGWDGKVQGGRGELVQEDVYVWKANVTDIFNKKHRFTGHVTVIR